MKMYASLVILVAALALAGCNTTPAQDGAVLGGALGAGLGAVIGHQSGHQGEGALIGAGAGALTGALIGDQVGRVPLRASRHAAPAPPPPPPAPTTTQHGHYETRVVRTPGGETYEERVWVRDY